MGEAKRKKEAGYRRFRLTKKSSTTVIVIGCIVIIGIVDLILRPRHSPLSEALPARSKGDPKASLKIVEFVDFQCHECAKGSHILREYIQKYPDQIHLTVKYFSLGQLNSVVGLICAECAARQNRFWPYHDVLFDRQHQWRNSPEAERQLELFAQEVGLDMEEFRRCVKGDDTRAVIFKERTLGESHFVKSTPTYFMNKEMVAGVKALKSYLQDYFDEEDVTSHN